MPSTPICLQGRSLVEGAAQGTLLFADVGLSFWGGVDPASGEVIDRHHPSAASALRVGCWRFPADAVPAPAAAC